MATAGSAAATLDGVFADAGLSAESAEAVRSELSDDLGELMSFTLGKGNAAVLSEDLQECGLGADEAGALVAVLVREARLQLDGAAAGARRDAAARRVARFVRFAANVRSGRLGEGGASSSAAAHTAALMGMDGTSKAAMPTLEALFDSLGLGAHTATVTEELAEELLELVEQYSADAAVLEEDLEDAGLGAMERRTLCSALAPYARRADGWLGGSDEEDGGGGASTAAAAAAAAPSWEPPVPMAAAPGAPPLTPQQEAEAKSVHKAAERVTRFIRRVGAVRRGDEFKMIVCEGDVLGLEIYNKLVIGIAECGAGDSAGVTHGCKVLSINNKIPADDITVVALLNDKPATVWFSRPDFNVMAGRITRFISYTAAVKSGRVKGGTASRLFAMDGDKAGAKRQRKKRPKRASTKSLKDARASLYTGDTLHEGWLEKRSSRGKWQRRYFSARGHYLKYFPNDLKTEVKGFLDLTGVEACAVEDAAAGGCVFALDMGAGAPPMKLRAPDAEERTKWAAVFERFAADT
eukprot:g7207.t1